ncbi:HAMP domain-containing sensor histidine kinase [Roseburia hominis]
MAVNLVLLALLGLAIGYSIYDRRKTYRTIDHLLDCVLSQEKIEYSDVREGELSALVNKVHRIQEILGKQIENAREEKEQVKSLVSNMTHQLKTPLANLSVYTDILSSRELDEAQKAEATEKIRRQIEKLDWIIGSLAKMVKLEQGVIEFEAEDLLIKRTILDAIDTVYDKIEKKEITFVLEEGEDRPLYHNRKWTAEVLVNLLENAVKYTKRGGTIQMKICPYEIYTEIQIIDNGCGIHEEETNRIFQRFYRSPEVGHIEGSGIGLYLSNLILEKEKGYMTVRSVYGEGSCFSVFLQNCKN